MQHMDVPMDYRVWGRLLCWNTIKDTQKLANAKGRFLNNTEWFASPVHKAIDKAIVSFCNRFQSYVAATAAGTTDIENSLLKYRVNYRHLTVMIETLELSMKSCEKFTFFISEYSMCNCMFTWKS